MNNLTHRRRFASRRIGDVVAVFAPLVCWYLFAATAPILADDSAPLVPSECHPKALVTSDDDIRLSDDDRPPGRSVAIPQPVIVKLRAIAVQLFTQVAPGAAAGVTCKELFPHIYPISLPDRRDLFIAEIRIHGHHDEFFRLILYDPATGAVTENAPLVAAKWGPESVGTWDPLIKKPLVSTADLFQNHHPQIVFEECVRHGMYNAVIYHYFDVGPNLALTRVLSRETRVLALGSRNGEFDRELTRLSPGRLRLDTFEMSGDSSARKELGYVILESPGPGAPFHVAGRFPKAPHSDKGLVTKAPQDDDDFLREGYRSYY